MTELPDNSIAPVEVALEAENYIETYKIIAEWIRFADTKAAATLTVNGVLLGLIIPTLKTYLAEKSAAHSPSWGTSLAVALFAGWLVLLVASAVSAFLCILPLRGTHRMLAMAHTTHFHPAAVSGKFRLDDVEGFAADCDRVGAAGFKREVQAAMLIDAHLSSAKYGYVARAIRCLAASVAVGFCYLVAIQF